MTKGGEWGKIRRGEGLEGGREGEGGCWDKRGRKVGKRREGRRRQVRHKKSLRGRPRKGQEVGRGQEVWKGPGEGKKEERRAGMWDVGRGRTCMGRLKGGRAGV